MEKKSNRSSDRMPAPGKRNINAANAGKNGADGSGTEHLVCSKCGVRMEEIEATFIYLGRTFKHKIPRCPSCGQALVTEDLAKGRMAEMETMLEDK